MSTARIRPESLFRRCGFSDQFRACAIACLAGLATSLASNVSLLYAAESGTANVISAKNVNGINHADHVNDAKTWARLERGGYIIVIRHASTVAGIGDPPGFTLDDCATQRNLSAEGRAQAGRWRAAISAHRVPIGDVFSSAWCRCVDTAALAFGTPETSTASSAPPKVWAALNSFFESAQNEATQTASVKSKLAGLIQTNKKAGKNAVLVTHQVNVAALTGVSPRSGEAVIIQVDARGNVMVVGRLWVG